MKYPIYVVSKSRWEKRLTITSLEEMNIPYKVIVEEFQYDNYAQYVPKDNILILPQKFLDDYDTCDDLGSTKSKGPGAARNFAWDHALKAGYKRHWVMDDNMENFYRLNRNARVKCMDDAIFCAAEDFVDRYKNVPVSGFNYRFFCPQMCAYPPFAVNTRIYSCLLIENDTPYRWRGRYNEDTDLSLQVLKDGKCTIQFNAFLCGKLCTQVMGGGNTEAFYSSEGTLPKSQMLVDMHPDVSRLVHKFGRWHHEVNYKVFANNKLEYVDDYVRVEGINEYGMKLIEVDENE